MAADTVVWDKPDMGYSLVAPPPYVAPEMVALAVTVTERPTAFVHVPMPRNKDMVHDRHTQPLAARPVLHYRATL